MKGRAIAGPRSMNALFWKATFAFLALPRNPMYVAVVLILLGWMFVFRSWPLAVYALAIGAGFHLRVILVP